MKKNTETKVARPTEYNKEIAKDICSKISTSHKSLRTVAKEVGVCVQSILNWLNDYPEFLAQYTRAKEEQADFLTEEMIEIADDSSKDTITQNVRGGELEVENREWTNRSKLRVETRKWIASKLKPKKYGDKLELDQKISGGLTIDVRMNGEGNG